MEIAPYAQSLKTTKMLNDKQHNRLPAGLMDKSVEFYVHRNQVYCLHDGSKYAFEDFPKWILDVIEDDMLKYPEAIKSLASWENLQEDDYIRQYIYCRFGGIDSEPDIDENKEIHHSEYFDCGLRGVCKYEGKLCPSLKVANGYISPRELDHLKLIQLPDKQIADKLHISIDTVFSHKQNIYAKTGMKNKVELAVLASKKGII